HNIFGGGAESGAAAAIAPALMGVLVGSIAAATIVKTANRAVKERDNIAGRLLKAYQLSMADHVKCTVAELLRLTRAVLTMKLNRALRLDDPDIHQGALTQALSDVGRARNRMLEQLGGGHVA